VAPPHSRQDQFIEERVMGIAAGKKEKAMTRMVQRRAKRLVAMPKQPRLKGP